MTSNNILWPSDDFSHHTPVIRLGRFIAPTADYAVSKLNVDDQRSQSSVLAGLIIGPSSVTLSRREGSVTLGVEMLRYAQHDSAVTQTDARINVFMCIIGLQWAFLYQDYFLKLHYRPVLLIPPYILHL